MNKIPPSHIMRRFMTMSETTGSVEQAKRTLNRYFALTGALAVDASGNITVDGNCHIKKTASFARMPLNLKAVTGDFSIDSVELTTLVGCPDIIGGHFSCDNNNLTNLNGGPSQVGSYYSCEHNKLTSLNGSPSTINSNFMCSNNKLTSLSGSPNQVTGYFEAGRNPLVSLEHLPSSVGYDVYISWSPTLPLLRLLSYKRISLLDRVGAIVLIDDANYPYGILKQYLGDGNLRKRIVACQKALIDAGFEGNASW